MGDGGRGGEGGVRSCCVARKLMGYCKVGEGTHRSSPPMSPNSKPLLASSDHGMPPGPFGTLLGDVLLAAVVDVEARSPGRRVSGVDEGDGAGGGERVEGDPCILVQGG
jgi:hypothetical protein